MNECISLLAYGEGADVINTYVILPFRISMLINVR